MSVKILLVAKKAEDRLALEGLLRRYDMICAGGVTEALSALDGRPDVGLVVAELNKADKAGLLLLEIFKADSRYAGLRLIALTEPGEPEMEISALKAGAADCVRKPLLAEVLQNRIDTQLQLISLKHDITRREEIEKALLESERSKSVLLSNLPGMAYRCNYDREWTMQFVSEGCHELTGYQADELLYNKKLSFNDIIAPEYREALWDRWRDIVREKRQFREEYEIITASGKRKWVLETGQVIFGEAGGEVEALEGIIIDISDRKEKELRLKHISEMDRLTGLYNRLHFESILRQAEADGQGGGRALVLINLKRLNTLKVTYGYNFSESVIKRVASRLAELSGEHRLLLKISFEIFAFYMDGYAGSSEIEQFVFQIINALKKIRIMFTIGCAIGIAEFAGWDADAAIKSALAAAESTENSQPFEYRFFDSELEERERRDEEIIEALVNIINASGRDRLLLRYQPILDLKTGRIGGFEALARLESEKLGQVSPEEFIRLAEETQIIVPMGKIIMKMACAFKRRLEELGCSGIAVFINISATQLVREAFARDFTDIIRESGIDPTGFGFEITESVFADNFEMINEKLSHFISLGIQIAMDDFGTGYSSLSREREMNVTCLKISKAFIDKLSYLEPEKTITGEIIAIAHRLGQRVIAEGVENEGQVRYLVERGCDMLQGYYYSKPLLEEEAIAFAKTHLM